MKWKYWTANPISSSPGIGADSTVYVGSLDTYLYALNSNGALKWKFKTGNAVWSSPAIGANGTVYVGSHDGYFSAVKSDGTLKWKYQTGNSVFSLPAIDTDGTLYVGSMDGNLYAFTPETASVTLSSPNGGESLTAGSSQNITWTSSLITNVKLEYSANNGSTWSTIVASTPASAGSYAWTVPDTPAMQYLVRISDPSNASVNDQSDGVFTVTEEAGITVTSPNGGESWTAGSTKQITWQFKGVDAVKIELSTDGGVSFPPSLLIVDNPDKAASGTFSWAVPDLKSDKCVIRISDRTNSALYDKSDGFFSIIRPGVTIQHTVPRNVAAQNDTITFVALVTGTSEIAEVTLYYDYNGRRKFDNIVPMTKSGSDGLYRCSLGKGKFTSLGMEYYITARDINNVKANAPADTGFYNICASVEGMVSPYEVKGGGVQNSYRMISIPLNLVETSITGQLAGTLKGAMGTDWRLFRYNPLKAVYEEYPNIEGFTSGIAFWMISRNNFKLQPPQGTTVTTAESFSMTLKPGWNDIANPWMFDISWEDMVNSSKANLSKPYSYENGWSDPTNAPEVLNPWTGYSVKNLENYNVVIWLQPKPAGLLKPVAENPLLWELTLKAAAGLAFDNTNHLGVSSDASEEWDIHDHVEPPPIGEYVSICFPHRNWKRYPSDYTVDIRPTEGQLSWDFDVRTNISHENVTVTLDGVGSIPAGLNLTVTNRDTGEDVNIQGNTFNFISGVGFTERHFTLMASNSGDSGREDINKKPVSFVTANSYPNPFNPSTVIRYELSERGKVAVSVYNAVGQKVREYNLGYRERGVHELVFDARELTSGLYVYHIDAGYASVTKKMLFMK